MVIDCVLRDLNEWIGDMMRAGITGAFGVPGENQMGEEWGSSVLKGGCLWITYFEHKSWHKYTRVARDQDGVEVKSMVDMLLAKKTMLHFVQDVWAVRGME